MSQNENVCGREVGQFDAVLQATDMRLYISDMQSIKSYLL